MHAILGCDTTSGMYGIGTGAALKLSISKFRQQVEVYRHRESKKEEIITADETALVLLYKGNVQCSLNGRRVLQFNKNL